MAAEENRGRTGQRRRSVVPAWQPSLRPSTGSASSTTSSLIPSRRRVIFYHPLFLAFIAPLLALALLWPLATLAVFRGLPPASVEIVPQNFEFDLVAALGGWRLDRDPVRPQRPEDRCRPAFSVALASCKASGGCFGRAVRDGFLDWFGARAEATQAFQAAETWPVAEPPAGVEDGSAQPESSSSGRRSTAARSKRSRISSTSFSTRRPTLSPAAIPGRGRDDGPSAGGRESRVAEGGCGAGCAHGLHRPASGPRRPSSRPLISTTPNTIEAIKQVPPNHQPAARRFLYREVAGSR